MLWNKHILGKQLSRSLCFNFMHCVKKNNLFELLSTANRNIKIINFRTSRLLLIFPEIFRQFSGKFTTLFACVVRANLWHVISSHVLWVQPTKSRLDTHVFCYCRIILTTLNKYKPHVFTVFSKYMQVGAERPIYIQKHPEQRTASHAHCTVTH